MRWWLAVVLLLVAACTSATTGRGSITVPPPSSSSRSSASAPTSSVPGSSSATQGSGSLTCPAGAIAPSGAPFCYPLPAQFTDFSTRTDYGQGWTYRTLIGVGGPDLVEVLGSLKQTTSDTLSDAQLRAFYDRAGLIAKGKFGFASVGPVTTTRLDGARAFVQDGLYTTGVRAHLVRAFLGRSIVFVSCQSKNQPGLVAAACAQILAGIQIART